jgi:hypothetical protein
MPSLVGEMRVRTYRIDLHSHFLELGILIGHVPKFRWTNKSEVRGIEKEYGPFPFQIVLGDGFERPLMVGLGLEIRDFTID